MKKGLKKGGVGGDKKQKNDSSGTNACYYWQSNYTSVQLLCECKTRYLWWKADVHERVRVQLYARTTTRKKITSKCILLFDLEVISMQLYCILDNLFSFFQITLGTCTVKKKS